MNKRLQKNRNGYFFENIVWPIGVILLIFLVCINVIFSTYITQNANEIPVISRKIIEGIFLIIFSFAIFYYAAKWLENISAKSLFVFFAVIYTLFAIYLIFNVEAQIRSDAKSVYEGAMCMMQGDYSALKEEGYFFYYPHQLGLAIYNSLMIHVSSNIRVHFVLNYCMLMLINFIIWKSAELMFAEKEMSIKLTIILMFLFYPALFFVLFLYGHIPGLLCIMLAIYLFIKKEKRIGKYNDVAIVLVLICACTIRNNYMIAAIAISICYILYAIRKKSWYSVIIAVLIITTFSMGGNWVKQYYQKQSGIQINEGIPKILWVAMGLQDEETGYCMGGWWNMFTTDTYKEAGYDEKIAANMGEIAIQERIDEFAGDKRYAIRFFGKKIVSTWTDPTYQSIWSGPLEECGQKINTKLLKNIYSGGKIFDVLSILGRIITLSIYVGTIAFYVLKRIIENEKLLIVQYFPIIYLCGGFLFHLIWETKSQYVWSYVYVLIPLSACGWNMLIKQIGKKIDSNCTV